VLFCVCFSLSFRIFAILFLIQQVRMSPSEWVHCCRQSGWRDRLQNALTTKRWVSSSLQILCFNLNLF
jgi:hypothetical protein